MHGGGFRILSKDTRWPYTHGLARRGFLVCSIDYRLAPTHPYPAAHEDTFLAFQWFLDHAAEHGGDPSRLVYAGESAGGNLVTSLAIASSWRRHEPWAQPVFERDPQPAAVLSYCGMHQVSQPERYLERDDLPQWIRDRIFMVCRGYLPDDSGDPDAFGLADPVRFLESAPPPERPLPPFFAPCGADDPVLPDTERLAAALVALGVETDAPTYENAHHAFNAFVWNEVARTSWEDQDVFLDRFVPGRTTV